MLDNAEVRLVPRLWQKPMRDHLSEIISFDRRPAGAPGDLEIASPGDGRGQLWVLFSLAGGRTMSDHKPADLGDSPEVPLPANASRVAREQPELWEAFQRLGHATAAAGPLDDRSKRLVHLALAVGADSEGAAHSHARRGLADGISPAELEHVAYLAITTLGWPQAMRGLTWIRDVTHGKHRRED